MCKLPLRVIKTMSIFDNILALHMYLSFSNKGYGGFGDTKVGI